MSGGLYQLAADTDSNGMTQILTGEPQRSFFKTTYKQYTNFALQKFDLTFEGTKMLRPSEPSTFTFKVKRYADLLVDAYLCVTLPHIWSPILPPQLLDSATGEYSPWSPYEFRWIDHIGARLIQRVQFIAGNYILQEFSGDYLLSAVQRDFSDTKRRLFDEMTGHVPDLVDPANALGRDGKYPHAYFADSADADPGYLGPEPSIRSRVLCIPLNAWFGLDSHMAFPLISCQGQEMSIVVTLRPIQELFVVRDVLDVAGGFPYIAPQFNSPTMQLHRFVHPPPSLSLDSGEYLDTRDRWDTRIHVKATYAFLSGAERRLFARNEQRYLIKQVREHSFLNVVGSQKLQIETLGATSNWMFFFRRSDAHRRNQWGNYSNWAYAGKIPRGNVLAPVAGGYPVTVLDDHGDPVTVYIGPGVNADGSLTGFEVAPRFSTQNQHEILQTMGILIAGNYREDIAASYAYDWIEKYTRTSGAAPEGLYCYNYSLHSNNADLQPSGAIDMSRFNKVELEVTTTTPPLDPLAQSLTICDPVSGEVVGVNKPSWSIYKYTYDLYWMEERLNFATFLNGMVGLEFAT